MCNQYQGWTNYPTWIISIWISNEQSSYNYWNEQAEELIRKYQDKDTATGELADMLKNEIDDNDRPELDGMYNDILEWSMDNVNWYEIAEHITEDMEVESDDDDKRCTCGHLLSEHYSSIGTCLVDYGEGEHDFCTCLKFTAEEV